MTKECQPDIRRRDIRGARFDSVSGGVKRDGVAVSEIVACGARPHCGDPAGQAAIDGGMAARCMVAAVPPSALGRGSIPSQEV